MIGLCRAAVVLLALAGSACATLSPVERDRAYAIALEARSGDVACDRPDACADKSPIRDLAGRAFAGSTPDDPRHYVVILDSGQDAMLARLDLIRSATSSIDLQTYIFDQDDAGHLFLEELLAAARRGVRVRVLIDQLSALEEVETLAALSGVHENLQLRIYNPTFNRAQPNYFHYAMSVLCCFRDFNQRMHSKLLLVDGAVGITGGRNYQNDYYDWDPHYDFRDRDLLVAGPEARDMRANFEAFWTDRRSVPASRLTDVGGYLLEHGVPALELGPYQRPERVAGAKADAEDATLLHERVVSRALPVGPVHFIADLPDKHDPESPVDGDRASGVLRTLIESAEHEVLLQTPYLVLSEAAQDVFSGLQDQPDPPRVIVSTNSLAATDAFMVYALSHKYKRTYLRDYGFHIYEYKPFPGDSPIDFAATGAELPSTGDDLPVFETGRVERGSALRRRLRTETRPSFLSLGPVTEPVRLERAGLRIGLHAKSLVVDERVGVVGTHNFDPRSDNYNTESAVVVPDPAFAQALAASIRRDIAPANSWLIARRPKPPVLSGLEYSLGKAFEQLPLFDIWPIRYATSYEFQPGPDCPVPVARDHPDFQQCYKPVGDFPEVAVGTKWLYTRILMAFGAGLAPVL
ncbi:MAG TPA: phospholipase D family protein [Xanthomonadaceae bacterium]|nr:phospholipase D family protein [Xanthomonadaceae bacterium]